MINVERYWPIPVLSTGIGRSTPAKSLICAGSAAETSSRGELCLEHLVELTWWLSVSNTHWWATCFWVRSSKHLVSWAISGTFPPAWFWWGYCGTRNKPHTRRTPLQLEQTNIFQMKSIFLITASEQSFIKKVFKKSRKKDEIFRRQNMVRSWFEAKWWKTTTY